VWISLAPLSLTPQNVRLVVLVALRDDGARPAGRVWEKQADGKWKTVADIFNSGLVLPAPPEPTKSKKNKK
jgi:hypothetical protein